MDSYCQYCINQIQKTEEFCPYCGRNLTEEGLSHHLAYGTILNEKYYVGAALGEGGFGITYIGRDLNLDMRVAIKEYYPNGFVNRNNTISQDVNVSVSQERHLIVAKGCERFIEEAHVLARFGEEVGIVGVRDFFRANGTAYIVMDYLDGITLKEYLQKHGTLTFDETIDLLLPVMQSLMIIHRDGLIHRDISPDNIMLVKNTTKLIDFGSARTVTGDGNKSLSIMLKEGYAPEEQYRSKGKQGPWTDVYALSATMYKCITGVTPDDATQRIFVDELKVPSRLGILIDSQMEKVLLKGLQIRQFDRYQTIDDFLQHLLSQREKGTIQERDVSNATEFDLDKTVLGEIGTNEQQTVIDKQKTVMGNMVFTMASQNNEENDKTLSGDKDVDVFVNFQPIEDRTVFGENLLRKESFATDLRSKINAETKIKAKMKQSEGTEPIIREGTKKRRKVGLLVGVLVIFAILLMKTILLGPKDIMILGEEVSGTQTYLYISDETMTVNDMKAIASLGELMTLSFENCVFQEDAFSGLAKSNSDVKKILLTSCQGIDDFSALNGFSELHSLSIINCGLTDDNLAGIQWNEMNSLSNIELSNNPSLKKLAPLAGVENMYILDVSYTSVIDFSDLTSLSQLKYLHANGNNISTLASLDNEIVCELYLADNNLSDLSTLDKAISLKLLDISNNKFMTLESLFEQRDLQSLYASNNQLSDLSGIEYMIYLENLYVEDNRLVSLNGLENATILKEVHLDNNLLEDISILSKSAKTLTVLSFDSNRISDITSLKSTAELQYLSMNNNKVSSLVSIVNSGKLQYLSFNNNQVTEIYTSLKFTELEKIYADNNLLQSIGNLSGWESLEYLSLSNNLINEVGADQIPQNDFKYFDVSNNNISDFNLIEGKKYDALLIYGNPIGEMEFLNTISSKNTCFTYNWIFNITKLTGVSGDFYVLDCPLDKQVAYKKQLVNCYFIEEGEVLDLRMELT